MALLQVLHACFFVLSPCNGKYVFVGVAVRCPVVSYFGCVMCIVLCVVVYFISWLTLSLACHIHNGT